MADRENCMWASAIFECSGLTRVQKKDIVTIRYTQGRLSHAKLLVTLLISNIFTPSTCKRGKAIGFVCRQSSAQKSPDLKI